MELLSILTVLAIVIVVVVYFSSTLTRIANLADGTIDTGISTIEVVNELTVDTVGTYKHEVKLSNAEKRADLMKKYSSLDKIYSVDDLDSLHAQATEAAA